MTATQQIEVKDSAARSAQAVDDLRDVQGEKMILNMGPSHPATHGVLRLILELDGEIITKATTRTLCARIRISVPKGVARNSAILLHVLIPSVCLEPGNCAP